MSRSSAIQPILNLRAEEWVEVRSSKEILEALDERGCFENMPFMPEMLQYCGQRLRVSKRADKTCQYIIGWSIRRVMSSVHLENVRCDGSGHGGCEAGCLIFWKEAWLKRTQESEACADRVLHPDSRQEGVGRPCTAETLHAAGQTTDTEGQTRYSCQATDVYKFSSYMSMWDPRQYLRDLRSGNLASGLAGTSRGQRFLDNVLGVMRLLSAILISFFNRVQTRRYGALYPLVEGMLERTPLETLNLQPGELVEVRSKEEIMATLDKQNRNRGLLFDFEMLTYCGGIYRVLRRVHRIIDEKSGRMINMKYPCLILEGVFCRSDYHGLCPRAIYHYWRESWVKKVADMQTPRRAETFEEACQRP